MMKWLKISLTKTLNEEFIYIALTILFQPFIKIALGRALWNIVDIFVGIGLLVTVFTVKKSRNK